MDDVLSSSSFHGWQTPESFLELVRAVAPIALDPCTTHKNPTQARSYMTADPFELLEHSGLVGYDGLEYDWSPWCGQGLAFMNPPYGGALKKWMAKAAQEAAKGIDVVALVPARPDTAWFQDAADKAEDVLFWRGRITFTDPRAPEGMMLHSKTGKFVKLSPAAFPSAVFYFGGHRRRMFRNVFAGKGLFLGGR